MRDELNLSRYAPGAELLDSAARAVVLERAELLAACRAALPYVQRRGEIQGGPAKRAAVLEQVRSAIKNAEERRHG